MKSRSISTSALGRTVVSHLARRLAMAALAIVAGGHAIALMTSERLEAQPVVAPAAAPPSPIAFDVPQPIRVIGLKKDTSAAARYAAMEAADIARSDFKDYFGSRRLAPGEYVWRHNPSDRAALHIVVSIEDQRAYVYEGPILIAATTVSTGRSGHRTPAGIFPITEKHELRLSNLYNEAPMPFMQRLTNDGIALHAGHIPGVPASHGCIRLPPEFARRLFSATTAGTPVLISA